MGNMLGIDVILNFESRMVEAGKVLREAKELTDSGMSEESYREALKTNGLKRRYSLAVGNRSDKVPINIPYDPDKIDLAISDVQDWRFSVPL